MKAAIGYVRVSTAGQATEGVSLDAQEAKIRAWCAASGFDLAAVHVDAGLSGGRADNRPALQAALADVTKRKGVLVVYSLSRLARSTRDAIEIAERLEKADADLVSLSERLDTTSAAGRMIFRMLAVLAEFERDQIAERTKGAMAHLRANGKRISRHAPYGWAFAADGENLVSLPAEQEAIALMRRLRADGVTLEAIARDLEARGIPSKLGKTWTSATVRRILNREAA
ncbi:MAG: putative site-specific DNA [Planctomycetota bacterium]|nr:MAG: putative site-specific DNA [Planctomycetota bacterium]